jgi:hypothetical protein
MPLARYRRRTGTVCKMQGRKSGRGSLHPGMKGHGGKAPAKRGPPPKRKRDYRAERQPTVYDGDAAGNRASCVLLPGGVTKREALSWPWYRCRLAGFRTPKLVFFYTTCIHEERPFPSRLPPREGPNTADVRCAGVGAPAPSLNRKLNHYEQQQLTGIT